MAENRRDVAMDLCEFCFSDLALHEVEFPWNTMDCCGGCLQSAIEQGGRVRYE